MSPARSAAGRAVEARLRDLVGEMVGLSPADVAVVEEQLGLPLPEEVREGIAIWAAGQGLGLVELRSWHPDTPASWNVVAETLRIRAALSWRKRFVYLAEGPVSVVVLDAHSGKVTWFDSVYAPLLSAENPLVGDADVWPDYLTFLLALCDREAELAED